MAKTTGEIFVDVQFDCTCLYDGSIYREIISVPSEDLSKPDVITYLRELIEVKLSIPIVCQVNLSLGGICLDPITEEHSELPKMLLRNGERVPIYLEYYGKITNLQEIKQVIKEFPKIVEDRNYRTLFSLLCHLNHRLINIGQGGCANESALGARIYLKHCGFLSVLKILFANILKEISEKFSKLGEIQGALDFVDNSEDSKFGNSNQEASLAMLMEEFLLTLIFFSASAHNEVTRTIYKHHLYNQIFHKYSTKSTVFPINVAAEYNIGIFCMHMLKTPYLQYDESVLNQMLCILKQIISKADVVSAAQFGRSKKFWGTLEPSLSIFVKPWHCLIVDAGFIDSSDRLYTLVVELIEYYDKVALYMFDVTLESERNRQQFIDEGMLPYFVIVSWRVAGIAQRLRKFYPDCLRQVTNLKQIATISVGFQKEGYFYARSLDI